MSWTAEDMPAPALAKTLPEPSQLDLPSKEYIGYDPKGTLSVTNQPLVKPDPKQPNNSVEAPADAPTQEDSVTLSPKVSALARKEQAQRQREQAFARREKELADKIAAGEKFLALQEKIKAKDYSGAEELGIAYNDLAQYELDKAAKADPKEERISKLEAELAAQKKAQEDKTVEEYKANQALWQKEIKRVVSENDEFSTIRELKAEDAVLKHINDSFDEDGVELTAEEAAKEIEEALLARAQVFSNVPKLKSKASEGKVLGPPKTSPKTITQNMTVTSKETKPKPFHLMSESEQLAEAIRRVQAEKLQQR